MEISQFVGLVRLGEGLLGDAFLLVANKHERDAEIRDMCKQLATFSQAHVQKLEPIVQRYGMEQLDEPNRLRAALFHGTRVGGLGLLRDLQDLSLLAHQVNTSWLSLSQAAGSLHDKELEGICSGCMSETERQLAWLKTQIEDIAPQAITGTPEAHSVLPASLPKTLTPSATPDLLWSPLASGSLIVLVGILGLVFGQPWLIPSLGPTALLQATDPAHPSARFYNTLVGHLVGLVAGFVAIAIANAWAAPVVLSSHQLTLPRVIAALIAIVVTVLVCAVLRADHPPAGATTLLVALGSIQTVPEVVNLIIAVVLLAVIGEGIRQLRLRSATPRSV